MAVISYLPKFILEAEEAITLKDMGVHIEEGNINMGKFKVPGYKIYNLNECEVYDKLETCKLYESTEQEKLSYANRSTAVMFMKLRQAAAIKDPEVRIAATCGLLAAINALAAVNARVADRFISLVRSIN